MCGRNARMMGLGLMLALLGCLSPLQAAGPIGACCFPCDECVETDEASCNSQGGNWLGPDTNCLMCGEVPLFGACCLPDGCMELSVLCCSDLGGVFQGDGVPCTPESCLGACCLGGACEDGLGEPQCADFGGEHQGVGTECPAPSGADCNKNGEDDPVDIFCGTSDDLDFNGIPDECETPLDEGACCFGDGSCTDGSEVECLDQLGTYQGDGTDCVSTDCPVGGCGGSAAGECGDANGTPGCDDADCCNLICDLDPHCCDIGWDTICAAETGDICSMTHMEEVMFSSVSESPPEEPLVGIQLQAAGSEGNPDAEDGNEAADAVSDPIYLWSGEFYEAVVDLRIRGRGMDFVWGRKYRSRVGPDTAMGNGWDFSYNIWVEPVGPDLLLHDGHTRLDRYLLQPSGKWTQRGLFRELQQNPDTSFRLEFADGGMWSFHPLDGSAQEGKINSIVDRNGNTLTFNYDGLGRLVQIHDTLDTPLHNRDIAIIYNADGFIESVTDFIGRTVAYEYYPPGDPDGDFGDLKSVTSPAVVGTPNGNDFPIGKTTVYTYSTGFAHPWLNHNLLTITDPKGQTYLINEYAPTQDPHHLNFDRIARQTWGDPADLIDLVYVPQVPDPSNNDATIKVIVNDRVGDVKEFFYDAHNHVVMAREFTGRADPDLPTSEVDNRPTNKLRPSDPDFFETRHEWNDDALVTQIHHPNLNIEVFAFDTINLSQRARGNLLQHLWLPGLLGGDQGTILESWEYDPLINGDHNFVTRHVDGRGHETLHNYDPAGNRTHTQHRIPTIEQDWAYNPFGQVISHTLPDNGSGHRREDQFTYHPSGPQMGYLHERIVDAPGFALTTILEYDEVGNVTRVTDPNGNDTQFVINQLDEVVRRLSREVVPGGSLRYETDTFYDANDNIVRVDVQNIDEAGVLQANTHLSTLYEYDVLNFRTRICEEGGSAALAPTDLDCSSVPAGEFIMAEFEYDANRNRTLKRFGEATNGNQLTDNERILFDERDLVFRIIQAEGDPDQSTTQVDYDGNRNITVTHEGIEDTPRITVDAYDGYDRTLNTTDPMGNDTEYHYDANHNRISRRVDGELVDVPGSAANVRLSERTYVYDDMDRLIFEEIEFFDTATQNPLPGGQQPGKSISATEYSENSQVTRTINDNLHQTTIEYDTANRREVVTDHKGNAIVYEYDQNSNVVQRRQVEKPDLPGPDELFEINFDYDGLDRLMFRSDNVGNLHTYGHDSRHNRTVVTDALGNETRYVYDGIDRLLQTIRDMNGNGAGSSDPADITTSLTWDDSSRLVEQMDDSGNATTYVYDALDRLVVKQHADCTIHTYTYDVHDNVDTMQDANGTVVFGSYDLLDRPINNMVFPGPGVSSDTTFENRQYDGLSRLVLAEDDDSLITRSHDSRSQLTLETLNGQSTISSYDGVGNMLSCNYPGGRVIDYVFDELERIKTISDPSMLIATYDYVGAARVQRRDLGNGTRSEFAYDGLLGLPNDPSDFGFKKIVGTTHSVIGSGATIDDREYTWDRMKNKTRRTDVRPGGPQLIHDYAYDDAYRLTQTTVIDDGGITVRQTGYDLDGVGNRVLLSGQPDSGPQVGPYTMDPQLCEPGDLQMNQYSSTPMDSRTYDENGNLAALNAGLPDERQIVYDYRNQMVEYIVSATGERHTYAYDAFGRRIARVIDADGVSGGPVETNYFYDGWHVCEEQDGLGATQGSYVYGRLVDEILTMQRGGVDHFFHADDLGSVMAVTNDSGTVVERYEYSDYGQPTITDADGCNVSCPFDANDDGETGPFDLATLLAAWGPVAAGNCLDTNDDGTIGPFDLASLLASWGPCPTPNSGIGNPYMFTGRRYDPETGWYYYRTRYLDPVAGRFTTRDIIGMWGDLLNLGNGYAYVGNNPMSLTDPLGLEGEEDSEPTDVDEAIEKYEEWIRADKGSKERRDLAQELNDIARLKFDDAERKEFKERSKKADKQAKVEGDYAKLRKDNDDIIKGSTELHDVGKAIKKYEAKTLKGKIAKENERHKKEMKELKELKKDIRENGDPTGMLEENDIDEMIEEERKKHETGLDRIKKDHDPKDEAKAFKKLERKSKKWQKPTKPGSGGAHHPDG